ncbi:rlmJ, partial [Symbiodinium sp. CCMP2592]
FSSKVNPRLLQQSLVRSSGSEALRLWRCHAEKFDAVNIITVIRRVVLHSPGTAWNHIADWRCLLLEAQKTVKTLCPKDISALAWVLGRADMGVVPKEEQQLVKALVNASSVQMHAFTTKDLGIIAWAVAKLEACDASDPFASLLATETAARCEQLSGKEAVNLAWALAKMKVLPCNSKITSRETFPSASRPCLYSCWRGQRAVAHGKLGAPNGCKARVSQQAGRRKCGLGFCQGGDSARTFASWPVGHVPGKPCREVASLLWAYARLDAAEEHEALLAAFADVCLRNVSCFNGPGLARVAWAFATLGRTESVLFAALAENALPWLPTLDGPTLAKLAWAFAKADLEEQTGFMLTLANQVEQNVLSLNARDVAMLAWALAKVDAAPPQLMLKLAQRAVPLVPYLSPQGLATSAAAFTAVSVCPERLRRALVQGAWEHLSSFSAQELVDLQWAMASQPLCERALEDAISRAPGWSLRPPYEHFVQAGSLPDCFKHVVLVLLLQDMLSTESPIVYVDTHAGAGMYELDMQKGTHGYVRSDEGVGRLVESASAWTKPMPAPIRTYLDMVESCQSARLTPESGLYPGSPVLAAKMLSAGPVGSRAVLIEAAESVYAALCRSMAAFTHLHVESLHEDAYRGLPKILESTPEPERALVLIDPPYDLCFTDNFNFRLLRQLQEHWPAASVVVWYPLRDKTRAQRVYRRVKSISLGPVLACEMEIFRTACPGSAIRTGVLILRPAAGIQGQFESVLPALADMMSPSSEFPCHSVRSPEAVMFFGSEAAQKKPATASERARLSDIHSPAGVSVWVLAPLCSTVCYKFAGFCTSHLSLQGQQLLGFS